LIEHLQLCLWPGFFTLSGKNRSRTPFRITLFRRGDGKSAQAGNLSFDFVQREQASERSLWRFLENRPRPMGVVHNVTKKRCRAFFDFGGFSQ
jgi:hypothetical protein